jgi:Family of unknown function (DUF5764)
MDDFVLSNLHESKNEWCSRLLSIISPLVIEGIKSIFDESIKVCQENNEMSKYLMTFQLFLSRVPKWNLIIVEDERKRIIERSGCNYLEDLIACVHIIQLKVLTCIRVGNKQKQIDISIPKLDSFIHKVYIHVARKIYVNVYLFEKEITPLQSQKNGRELEIIVQECIMTTIRESIPTEDIIRAYMDESVEHEEEVIIEHVPTPIVTPVSEPLLTPTPILPEISPTLGVINKDDDDVTTRLKFSDYDSVLSEKNTVETINAPKTIERLEEISTSHALQRKMDEAKNDDNDDVKDESLNYDKTSADIDISLFDIEEIN